MQLEHSNQLRVSRNFSFAKKRVLAQLENLTKGMLILNDQDQQFIFGRSDQSCNLTITLTVNDQAFYERVILQGDLGAAESYLEGQWQCDDLTGLLQLLLQNRSQLEKLENGLHLLKKPLHWLYQLRNRNTLTGSKKNILAHYDIGNQFFRLFLDETMMYSSAEFHHASETLFDASMNKLESLCQQLQLKASDHVLEIGTGWGGFAIYAAQHYGCHITTTTISDEQHDHVAQLIEDYDLHDRITLLKQDYRTLEGQYDKLVSIEMIEAIGHQYLDTYFETCSNLLKPKGIFCLQAITLVDQRYEQALKQTDFIQKYIFPGGFLPSITAMTDSITRKTDMKIFHLRDIGPHYAETLKHWRDRFFNNLDQIEALGFDEHFIRMWEYYFCYCEAGFREQTIGTVQLQLIKPAAYQPVIRQ